MRLGLLHENALPRPFNIPALNYDPVDDTNQLVAYRLKISGRRTHSFAVTLNGQALARLSRNDSKWVHDNWNFTYIWKNELDGPMVLTRENRKYLDKALKELTYKIKEAISNRSADIVVLPIDPDQLTSISSS